jgi:single-stranded DNA-binding protein
MSETAASMIECASVGVLGKDAEVRASAKGRRYVKMNLRVAENDDAQWVSVLSFDPDAIPQAGTFLKGCKIYIEGRISMNEWTDQARRGDRFKGRKSSFARPARQALRFGSNRELQPVGSDRPPSAARSGGPQRLPASCGSSATGG